MHLAHDTSDSLCFGYSPGLIYLSNANDNDLTSNNALSLHQL